MTVFELYERYQIMPALRQHQLRVTAVRDALLVHDMGNILKFDLTAFPQFLEPQGLAYWENVKDKMAERYETTDEHVATRKIAEEIGLSDQALDYVGAVGFSQVTKRLDDPSWERKICCYADMRVAPYGVVSLTERLADGWQRYKDRPGESLNRHERLAGGLPVLEQQIFAKMTIRPDEITEASILPDLQTLATIELGTRT